MPPTAQKKFKRPCGTPGCTFSQNHLGSHSSEIFKRRRGQVELLCAQALLEYHTCYVTKLPTDLQVLGFSDVPVVAVANMLCCVKT